MRLPWPLRRDPLAPLLGQARSGDEQAFCALYEALYPAVWSFVSRRTRSREDAEDALSRTFHRLLEQLEAIDPRRGSVIAWALRVARNLLIDDARTRHGGLGLERAEAELAAALVEEATPLDALLRDEELRALRAHLGRLDAPTRELLALRFGDGLSHAEVAVLLGSSEPAVRQRFSRALRTLRTALAADGGAAGEAAAKREVAR